MKAGNVPVKNLGNGFYELQFPVSDRPLDVTVTARMSAAVPSQPSFLPPMHLLRPFLAFALLFPFCWHIPSSAAAPAGLPAPEPAEAKQAIEQFLGLTAIWMLEMEWTHAYANKTPKAEDFRNAMLAAGLQQCPSDFQEAWLRQTNKPGRNYAAPVLRKYGVSLKDLRERLQGKLFKINSRVHPPSLYDEDEQIPRMDPRTCGDPKAILEALAACAPRSWALPRTNWPRPGNPLNGSCWNSRWPTWKPPSA